MEGLAVEQFIKKKRMKCVVHDYINTLVPILWTIYKKKTKKQNRMT